MGSWARYQNRFVLGLVFAILVTIGLALFADIRTLPQTLATFRWEWLPLILGLTLVNYGLRFVKWQYYLRVVEVRGVGVRDSLVIFLSGMTMAMTPGKVGELLKSYMLKQVGGTPVAVSAPIIAAERLTDGLAMVGLAAIGMVVYTLGWQVLVAFVAIALVMVLIVQNRPLVHRLLAWGERLPVVSRVSHHLYQLYDSAERLLGWRCLAIAISLGLVSWAAECLAFYFVLIGLGFEQNLTLLLQATFILAMSTLIGAASMLPGGIGAAEASVTGLLLLLIQRPMPVSSRHVAATRCARSYRLRFLILVGVGLMA